MLAQSAFFFFFFNDTATTEIYTLSLHDALPISGRADRLGPGAEVLDDLVGAALDGRSEEHTSELQSQSNLVCRLLLEKKKNNGLDTSKAYAELQTLTERIGAPVTPRTMTKDFFP